tara:strand:+ start:479 stop:958 length:480 start_codon:yes stop_codon:yes gene_type:complete
VAVALALEIMVVAEVVEAFTADPQLLLTELIQSRLELVVKELGQEHEILLELMGHLVHSQILEDQQQELPVVVAEQVHTQVEHQNLDYLLADLAVVEHILLQLLDHLATQILVLKMVVMEVMEVVTEVVAEVVQAVLLELMQEHQMVVDPVVLDTHQQF